MINQQNDKKTKNEILKESCPSLAGSISQELSDPSSDHFSAEDYEFLKFHGIYQQDDRDLRKEGKKFIFMVRVRIPGGVITSEQYLTLDDLSREFADNTLRITSRQGIQFHKVIKSNLVNTVKKVNEILLTTLSACGDVARNIMASPLPVDSPVYKRVYEDALRLSSFLLPKTPAYHDIWIDGVEIDLNSSKYTNFEDPLYGKAYLPRKFKVAFAIPPLNDIDVFTNCLGFVAITENNELIGYNMLAGGGMGRSHGNQQTYPRLADVVGFLPPDKVLDVTRAVVEVFKEFGDRTNRKHARLKYVLAEKGVDWFRNEVEKRADFKFSAPRPFRFTKHNDSFGWHKYRDNEWFLGINIPDGRIKDTEKVKMKTALRQIASEFRPEFRMTPNNNLYLVGIPERHRQAIEDIFKKYGFDVNNQGSSIRLRSMACVALPTCGQALAEAERYMPDLLSQIENILNELGIPDEPITVRMTGCPNGCARPYTAEIAFVGKAPGKYQIYLGGNESNTRLNRLYKDSINSEDIANELYTLLKAFTASRLPGEKFGDWCLRYIFKEQNQ